MATLGQRLLHNASATGVAKKISTGGDYMARCDGTFNGATVKLQQMSPDGVNWLDITDAAFTAEGSLLVTLAGGVDVRGFISGGPPAGIYLALNQVR